jgi:two-component system, LytTR family, response regulator AlgR
MNGEPINTQVLKVLIVDDESLARVRMRTLLTDCKSPAVCVDAEAANAVQAMEHLRRQTFDVALLDIHMPGADGLALAAALRAMPQAPALIFVTAHAEHAVQAFELDAVDYLTKPVRLERLQTALQKALRHVQSRPDTQHAAEPEEALLIQERARIERVPLHQVVYFKAELKYITVRTSTRRYILDGALNDLEEKYAKLFIRIHRNALIARRAVHALEKHFDAEEGDGWAVRLHGVDELLSVSRRQLSAVRGLIAKG